MSVSPSPVKARIPGASHPVTLVEAAVFAVGLVLAALIGVAASGALPI